MRSASDAASSSSSSTAVPGDGEHEPENCVCPPQLSSELKGRISQAFVPSLRAPADDAEGLSPERSSREALSCAEQLVP